eukprot:TRINITY_DN4929_c0_g1_i1.p1 TRINITY_DN4929_c0_g1~~TRINITY_DN4929_c0_g1_i1.p1  ORF type:complete len:596 (+),score=107.56 TRINITY_DN4929_c0_g1_i1:53-1840(+)
MKASCAALTCVLLASFVAAKKLSRDSSTLITEAEPWCTGNVIPASIPSSYEIGMSNRLQVFNGSDLTAIRNALAGSPAWTFDRQWQFKAKVTSGFQRSLTFGMAGGRGFLAFSVPANADAKVIQVQGQVKTEASVVSLNYKGSAADLLPHKVTFADICLRQLPCSEFTGCLPKSKYTTNNSANGDTPETCCMPKMCKDEVSCAPSSKFEEYEDQDTRLGDSIELCCKPKMCSAVVATLCVDELNPKAGSGIIGSTVGECCEQKFCKDFTGCDPSHDTAKLSNKYENGSMRVGFSVAECCNIIACSDFNCSKSDLWTNKSDNANISGHSFSQCCDPVYCANYTCAETTKYVKKENPPVQGSSDDRCCKPLYCTNYTCSNSSLTKMTGGDRFGSTDEECCEVALCIHYNCSDSTKYWKKPNLVETDGVQGPRLGNSDDVCCTPLYCSNFSCSSTKWKPKVWGPGNDTVLGWTHEQCCDKVFCENHTCTTDYDGDGNGTKWYKRMDTNSLKWQGSTDEECCYPLYCSQYVTQYPTKWTRKRFTGTPLLGSSDPECYDPKMCSKFCCDANKSLALVADAEGVQGSTEDECCENATSTSG